jgi:hypothetical protein
MAHYSKNLTIPEDFKETVLGRVREMVEKCDHFAGFDFITNVTQGAGSGLYSKFLSALREEYCDRMSTSYVTLETDTGDQPFSIVNQVLAFHQMIENADIVHLLENSQVGKICADAYGQPSDDFSGHNRVFSDFYNLFTMPYRFPSECETNNTPWKFCHNHIMFPRLHFFSSNMVDYNQMGGLP